MAAPPPFFLYSASNITTSSSSSFTLPAPSLSEHRKTTLMYKDMLAKSKAFSDTLELVSQQASEFSEALQEWSRHACKPYCLEDVLAIQKYSELLSLLSNRYISISEWVSSSFQPQLDTNLQMHTATVKSMFEKIKLAEHLLRKHGKKGVAPHAATTLEQLQGLQHHYAGLYHEEHQRCLRFVNQRVLECMVLETHWVWNPAVEHLRIAMHLLQHIKALPPLPPQVSPDAASFFTCVSVLNDSEALESRMREVGLSEENDAGEEENGVGEGREERGVKEQIKV